MAKNEPKEKKSQKTKVETEATKPLKVEITFPSITDLKQAIGTDADGNLVLAIQFKARADQFEIFRLVNLLKQPHGALYAVIGSPQSAMDFKFDAKQIRFEIFKADQKIQASSGKEKPKQLEPPAEHWTAIKIHEVSFNHIAEEKLPYGVAIDFVADGTGEIHSVLGRGMNPTEAVINGVLRLGILDYTEGDLTPQPFEVRAALEDFNHDEPNPECFKLIRVLEVGIFDDSKGD